MTEYWKSQDKFFCDICKCWLTDNKSSIDFHKNGKRHKENVEKRLKEIQRKNKADEKKEKKFEQEMARIEQAAAAAMQADGVQDLSSKFGDFKPPPSKVAEKPADLKGGNPALNLEGAKILHRKEKPESKVSQPVPAMKTGSWAPISDPSYVDLELPGGPPAPTSSSHFKPAEKRKAIEFEEKTVSSFKLVTPSISSGWSEVVVPKIEFKKRKQSQNNVRKRGDDD